LAQSELILQLQAPPSGLLKYAALANRGTKLPSITSITQLADKIFGSRGATAKKYLRQIRSFSIFQVGAS
jgi:hypothetical protein